MEASENIKVRPDDRGNSEVIDLCDIKAEPPTEEIIKIRDTTITLNRESDLRKSIGFVLAFLFLETNKQISNFALSRSSDEVYPVPSSLLIVLVEIFKLCAVLIWSKASGMNMETWNPSPKFGLPAVCYCITNLIYLFALTVVAPPIWMVLIQSRTLYTVAAYKIVFGRKVTLVQMAGCILIVFSVGVARYSTIKEGQTSLATAVFFASQLAAIVSTVASVTVELFLKNDRRAFCEQQFWLYFWGSIFSSLFMLLNEDTERLIVQLQKVLHNWYQLGLLCISITSTSFAGLCIPLIVKSLDTIVKDYLGAANNLLLAVVTAVLFPTKFSINWMYMVSLVMLLTGIWLYEKKTELKN